jgi:hypothetical protein
MIEMIKVPMMLLGGLLIFFGLIFGLSAACIYFPRKATYIMATGLILITAGALL